MTDPAMEARNHGDQLPLERDPVLPVYRMVEHIERTLVTPQYRPGRIILDVDHTQRWIDHSPEHLLSKLGPGDCLLVPLYRGSPSMTDSNLNGRSVREKLPQFKRNVEFAIEAMRTVSRIVVANAGVETFMFDKERRAKSGEWVADFVRGTTEELRPLGIEPMYIYAEMHKDCYHDRWVVRDTMAELGVVQFTPMPAQMLNEKWAHQDREGLPYPILREYLSEGHFWGGLNFLKGLKDGMDELLKFLGFEAGVLGERYE